MLRTLIRRCTTTLHPLRADVTGQTTAEYALVMVGAAAIAGLFVVWATHSHAVSHLFDVIVGNVTKNAS